ncbi:MAG: ribose 5-phosphate isomerase A [Phycisphaerales bacterium]|nr:ribose 5-phosphate isomerase A [Planctomycetota bacterium]MCH8509775.1 ribose 5-phosphate isomerase A [Phycisphaerales bacterium]
MSDQPTTETASASDALAEMAVEPIVAGMLVGLGAGRTAARGIQALAERVRREDLAIKCVAASERAEREAKQLGLEVIDFGVIEEVDYLFDGADETDRAMRLMKGSRGAMTRERILCWASKKTVFMVTSDKVAEKQIGARCPLPIAVMAYGLASTRNALRHIGLNGVLRRDLDGKMFITDNGNLVLDATLSGDENLADLYDELNTIPGVIDHGLFLDEADEILIEHADSIERLVR